MIKLVAPPMRIAAARHSVGLKTSPVKGQMELLVGVNDHLITGYASVSNNNDFR